MKNILTIPLLSAAILALAACGGAKRDFIEETVAVAERQASLMLEKLGEPTGKNYPRTTDADGNIRCANMEWWTSGFFPGTLWYLYELTGKEEWREAAERWTRSLEPLQSYTGNHDIGFMMYCSFGNAERLAPQPAYRDILTESANSLMTRFDEGAGTIKSWERYRLWDGETVMLFPVIIDNMMNLELLFYASKVTGDPKYRDAAVSHANATMRNHFREDYSTYHVVDYDTGTGTVNRKATSQGYSDESTWARGQAWAIYGFTMAYRETEDEAYLATARGAADWFIRNMPKDFVPEWDFNIGAEGYTPDKNSNALRFAGKLKDSSAASITASAFVELYGITGERRYGEVAVRILQSLSSPSFRAEPGTNGGFILMHGVGSVPHNSEIDVPLSYADYYFMEALARYKNSGLSATR